MGFRLCFSNLPIDQCDLPGGPRQGNVSRSGSEVACDAAGNAFAQGERDDRIVLTIDNVQQKRKNCWSGFDRTGVAGCGSPRDEARAFTVDDHNRRARSEPPQPQMSRVTQLQSMKSFGVPLDIDNGLCGHRQRCEIASSAPTRQQDADLAMRVGDIDRIQAKKHFSGNRGPRESLSPRIQSDDLVEIDVNLRSRKRQVIAKPAADAILPTTACYSLACEVNHGAWCQAPRSKSFDYFEKISEAERYAKLLGRPNIESDRVFNRAPLVALMEKQQQVLDTIVDSDEEVDVDRNIASMSTTASEVSFSSTSDGQCAMIAILSKPGKPSLRKIGCKSGAVEEDLQEKVNALPLALRRVVSSLGRHNVEMLSDSILQDLTRAIGSGPNQMCQSEGTQCKGKTSIGGRLRATSRKRMMT
jgi:hypothetical protein